MFTWTCSSASNEMGVTPVRSPGWPARPNELLKYDPSIVMLFSRLSCPANESPNDIGLYCGVSRSRSSTRRLIVGRCASCCVETVVAAPVRWLLKMEPAADVSIVTGSSCTVACARRNCRSLVTPSVTVTPFWISWRYPTRDALTRYGPPTRIPGIVNRPSPRVIAAYVVPDGPCTATTRAPSRGPPVESLTRPAIAPVVTPWASAEPTTNIEKTAAATRARPEPTIQRMDGPLLGGRDREKVVRAWGPVKDAR